jgi:hypothetical protein
MGDTDASVEIKMTIRFARSGSAPAGGRVPARLDALKTTKSEIGFKMDR